MASTYARFVSRSDLVLDAGHSLDSSSYLVLQACISFCSVSDKSLREAKLGGFQTWVFPTFFGKGPDCVADPFGTVPRRCS